MIFEDCILLGFEPRIFEAQKFTAFFHSLKAYLLWFFVTFALKEGLANEVTEHSKIKEIDLQPYF